jgi:hypothetical protein
MLWRRRNLSALFRRGRLRNLLRLPYYRSCLAVLRLSRADIIATGRRQRSLRRSFRRCGRTLRCGLSALRRSRCGRFLFALFAINALLLSSGRCRRFRAPLRRLRSSQILLALLLLNLLLLPLPIALLLLNLLLFSLAITILLLFSFAITILNLLLFSLLLRRLIDRRSLVPALLTIIGLLIIALLLPASRSRRLATLFRRALFLPLVAPLIILTPNIFRTLRFADDFANRSRGNIAAGGTSNRLHTRPAIGKDRVLAAAKINCLAVEVLNHPCPIYNPGVVHNKITPIVEVIVKTMHIAEREE